MRLDTLLLTAALACAPAPEEDAGGGDDSSGCAEGVDEDGDGLDACAEEALGTDPTRADTDGDGVLDGDEADCVSDPLDADEQCYACGWAHHDPGTLEATGSDIGDVIENLVLVDQCGEQMDLWDRHGQWTVLFMTTEWCRSCAEKAQELPNTRDVFAALTGLDFSFVVVLYEDRTGALPAATVAERYAADVEIEDQPVTVDPIKAVLGATPYRGDALPGVCALSPELEILGCGTGDAAVDAMLTLVEEAAASRR